MPIYDLSATSPPANAKANDSHMDLSALVFIAVLYSMVMASKKERGGKRGEEERDRQTDRQTETERERERELEMFILQESTDNIMTLKTQSTKNSSFLDRSRKLPYLLKSPTLN